MFYITSQSHFVNSLKPSKHVGHLKTKIVLCILWLISITYPLISHTEVAPWVSLTMHQQWIRQKKMHSIVTVGLTFCFCTQNKENIKHHIAGFLNSLCLFCKHYPNCIFHSNWVHMCQCFLYEALVAFITIFAVQCSAVLMQLIFSKILATDHPKLACEGEVWGAFCGFNIWLCSAL